MPQPQPDLTTVPAYVAAKAALTAAQQGNDEPAKQAAGYALLKATQDAYFEITGMSLGI